MSIPKNILTLFPFLSRASGKENKMQDGTDEFADEFSKITTKGEGRPNHNSHEVATEGDAGTFSKNAVRNCVDL